MADRWNRDFVKADAALTYAGLGNPATWGVSVAHLDTGYSFHPAMGFPASPGGLEPGDTSAIVTYDDGDFWNPQRTSAFDPLEPADPIPGLSGFEVQARGHGTFSGSVMAGRAGQRFSGVIPGLTLRSLRVTDGSVLTGDRPAAVAAAIRHVAQPDDDPPLAPVINISLGRLGGHSGMKDAVDQAYRKGVMIVAAAGQVSHRVVYPARYERCIAVAGIEIHRLQPRRYGIYAQYDDEDDGYAFVDIWAPARGIERGDVSSALGGPTPPLSSYQYGYVTNAHGTTYATVHVSAAAALWLAFHGEAALAAAYASPWMRIEAFRKLLLTHNTGSPFPTALTQSLAAHGNKARALDMLKLLKAPLPAIAQADKRN
jgi:hypothetical protein